MTLSHFSFQLVMLFTQNHQQNVEGRPSSASLINGHDSMTRLTAASQMTALGCS